MSTISGRLNNNNQLFFVSIDNRIHEIHWNGNDGWVNGGMQAAWLQLVKNPSPIYFLENHVYYVGANNSRLCDIFDVSQSSWGGGTIGNYPLMNGTSLTCIIGSTGHNIFAIGQDARVRFTIWDDRVCLFTGDPNYCAAPQCQGQEWHNGVLNATANNAVALTPIAATDKSYYFVGSDGKCNVFLRPIVNGIDKPGWGLTMDDEFSSLKDTKKKWDSMGPWAHGWCNSGQLYGNPPVDDALWGDLQYGDGWNNFSIANGIGRITTKHAKTSGLTWGWATNEYHNDNYYQNWTYNYANTILCTGGINVGFECDINEQYCYCGGNSAPPNCQNGDLVNLCGNYTPKYITGIDGPAMVVPKFYQKYGWFEIRCKVPRGKMMWNAFWAVGKGYYPEEIDFFEIEGNGKTMLSNIYYQDCQDHKIHSLSTKTYAVGYRYYDDFYTYACEWAPNYVKWYLNNELIAVETQPSAMQRDSMWVEINNYVVNARAQCDPEIFPNYFDIDYVRVYQKPEWMTKSRINAGYSGGQNMESNSVRTGMKGDASSEMMRALSIFPNPAQNKCTVALSDGELMVGKLCVYNTLGAKEIEMDVEGQPACELNISGFNRGIYMIRVSNNESQFSANLIIGTETP